MRYLALVMQTLAICFITLFFANAIITIHAHLTVNGLVKIPQKNNSYLLISGWTSHNPTDRILVTYHRY